MTNILNTPSHKKQDNSLKLKISASNISPESCISKAPDSYLDVQDANFVANVRETPSSDSESDTESKVNPIKDTIYQETSSAVSEYYGKSFLCENRSILSPSSKYNTPTPPLRPNQFVRNVNPSNRTRRKFSMIRETFESPDMKRKANDKPRQMITARSNNDLYENISNDFLMLRNSVREKQDRISKCKSVPSFVDESENQVMPDQRYLNNILQNENILRPRDLMRNQWSTKSHQNFSQVERSFNQQNTNTAGIGIRNKNYRRSMSILGGGEGRSGSNDPRWCHRGGAGHSQRELSHQSERGPRPGLKNRK